MCQILPSRVISVEANRVLVELADGQTVEVDASLKPEVSVGDYVLVDRGLVVEVIALEEAEAIIAIYAEMSGLLEAEDALA